MKVAEIVLGSSVRRMPDSIVPGWDGVTAVDIHESNPGLAWVKFENDKQVWIVLPLGSVVIMEPDK